MGYTTDFKGTLTPNKPFTKEITDYINKFSKTRRMKRDWRKIPVFDPNWEKNCWHGKMGVEGEYYVGGKGWSGQDHDESIINYNYPPCTQPGLWCQWIINENGEVEWDGNEKFYNYVEWLHYLIDNFFAAEGYILNGEIEYLGEDPSDHGLIVVKNNCVKVEELEPLSDEDYDGWFGI